ncbi:LacI family DNA-binding transcriptional regulator [Streptomyces sp. VRA16 Mangrove soil]|uniref:LacI family DNA-binding transcriptional regulator n=1 Tax=Streptomyces sp. VRA16 Mangrove soil TaxID=2817434 RepID=UPI001A9FF8EC|nr:LacI family DNA-binding transcriptional regulator [Streptomyces sp. VRA16 Mangrove soil]MBO1330324.1 LacI family DNA-binding transcriptional regulator [Streptomyces sp. VRA16 Mangrove soil]
MARKPTIADVAQRAGVSRATVSFALNDRPGVAEETKARIMAAAAELGWTPSRSARALSLGKVGAYGLVLARDPEQIGTDLFFPAFIAGVETVIGQRGDGLMVHVTTPSKERGVYERMAAERQVDGVLLTDLRQDDPRPALLQELGLPAVVVGRPEWGGGLTAVSLDDEPAYAAAVRRLAELGHRSIAHVEGPQELRHAQRRRQAWEQTLAALGLPAGPVLPGGFSAEGGALATRELLGRAEPPTAIVYGNDLAAMAGLSVAQELGVRVPDQLSVVGYDDTPLTRYSFPPLASARADARGWGEAAARALDAVVAVGEAAHVKLPPARFVPRASIGPAPRG